MEEGSGHSEWERGPHTGTAFKREWSVFIEKRDRVRHVRPSGNSLPQPKQEWEEVFLLPLP
jgi:hypothetical protein